MAAKLFAVLSLAVAASAVHVVPVQKYLSYEEPTAPAHYDFQYSVHDEHSGDIKEQKESRSGDAVQGYYSLLQPDGVHRIVEYSADKEHGFNANVRYEGHPTPAPAKHLLAKVPVSYAPVAKLAYASPVAKVAYAAPVAKVAYAAPIKVAYAAPAAKVAYSAPVSHFTYSSPIISYHH